MDNFVANIGTIFAFIFYKMRSVFYMKNNEKEQSRKSKNQLHIRLNENEYQTLQNWKTFLGVASMNDVIRMFIHSGCAYKFDYSAHSHYATELAKIGNNINQIAYRINATNNIYKSDMEVIKMYMEEMQDLLRDFLNQKAEVIRNIENEFLDD